MDRSNVTIGIDRWNLSDIINDMPLCGLEEIPKKSVMCLSYRKWIKHVDVLPYNILPLVTKHTLHLLIRVEYLTDFLSTQSYHDDG